MSAELALLLRERDQLRARARLLDEARAVAVSHHGADSFEARSARQALSTLERRLAEIGARSSALQREDNDRRAAHNAERTKRRQRGDRRATDLIADAHRMLMTITKKGHVPKEIHMLLADLARWLKDNAAVLVAALVLVGCSAPDPFGQADADLAAPPDLGSAADLHQSGDLHSMSPDAGGPLVDLAPPPPDMVHQPCTNVINCVDARDQSTCTGTCAAGTTCVRNGYNGAPYCIPCGATGARCCHQTNVPYCVAPADYCRTADGPIDDRCTT